MQAPDNGSGAPPGGVTAERDALRCLPRLFLLLGCPLGLLFAFLIAPLQVPDEMAHLYRAYAVSQGYCVAPERLTVPAAFGQLRDAFPEHVETVRALRFSDFLELLHPPQSGEQQITNVSANIYNCAPYLISGLGISLARLFSLPPIVPLFAARLANLAFYLFLVFTALRLLPIGRLYLFCLALMPMTLHQAASVSADAPALASAFLFFACVLRLALDPRLPAVSTRHLALAGVLLLFASLCKFNLWISLLLLIIPAARIGSFRRKITAIALICGIVCAAAVLWQLLNRPNLAAFEAARARLNIFPQQNAAFILHQPAAFAGILLRTWRLKSAMYAVEFVGTLGWLAIDVPDWLVFSWFALLGLTALLAGEVRLAAGARALCLFVAAASIVSIFTLLWTIELSRDTFLERVVGAGQGTVPAVQGRYFISIAPYLLLTLANRRLLAWMKRKVPAFTTLTVTLCATMVLLSAAVALTRVYQAYY